MHQFEASPAVKGRPDAASLPLVCLTCGRMTVDGKPVSLPPEMEAQAKDMAVAAEEAGDQANRDLVQAASTSEAFIASYFRNVYRTAYLDGFFRALMFFTRREREGRLKRLREIWQAAARGECVAEREELVGMTREEYDEFTELLNLGSRPES